MVDTRQSVSVPTGLSRDSSQIPKSRVRNGTNSEHLRLKHFGRLSVDLRKKSGDTVNEVGDDTFISFDVSDQIYFIHLIVRVLLRFIRSELYVNFCKKRKERKLELCMKL